MSSRIVLWQHAVRKKKGYTPSQGTLRHLPRHVALRCPIPRTITNQLSRRDHDLGHPKVADKLAHKKSPHAVKEAIEKKRKLSAAVPGKEAGALTMKPMMGSSNNNRMSEGFDQGTVTIHSPGHPLHGRKATVFYRHKDGRVNAQLRGPSHRAVQNLTLKPGEFKEHQKEETVNELSNSTLNSYIGKRIRQKAKAPAKQANVVAGVERATAKIDKKERRDAIMRNEAYSKSAVDKAIKRSGAKNSKAIHRLLKGHQKSDEPVPAKKSVKEEAELLADGKKVSSLKRKYMGKTRGTTDTGKPAHAIDIDPVLKSGGEINKVVK